MRPAVAAPASPLATETTMESAATAVESAATETSSAMEPTAAGEAAAVEAATATETASLRESTASSEVFHPLAMEPADLLTVEIRISPPPALAQRPF